jgi:hypothetical protein
MTPAEELAHVRERWTVDGKKLSLRVGDPLGNAVIIHEAYLFTKRREAEIEELKEDAKFLQTFIDTTAKGKCLQSLRNIMGREQAALAELHRGWRDQG